MKYNVMYDIDGGEFGGFAKLPCRSKEKATFEAADDFNAFFQAYNLAVQHARNYLSNPNTGKTRVTMCLIRDNVILNLEEVLAEFNGVAKQAFPSWDLKQLGEFSNGTLTISSDFRDKLLHLALEEAKQPRVSQSGD